MKHIFSILTVASLVAFGTAATSCVEEIPEVMDELALGRCLSPSNPVAKVVNGEYVEFSWDKTLGSEAFVLELYSDEAMSGENLLETFTLSVDEVPYTAHLEADMIYYARVKGTNEGVYDDSKWTNFEDAIQTYAIKSSVNPEVVARTKNSITITWTLPEGEPETPEIDHLVVSPAPEGNESGEVEVTSAALAAGQIEVTGLKSSVKYSIGVYFKSANRGEVTAWTRPDADDAVTIKDTAEFHQLIENGDPLKIIIPYADTVYVMGEMVLTAPMEIYGEETEAGEKPVVQGCFTLNAGAASIHCEAIDFDGNAYKLGHHITVGVAQELSTVSVLNCDIHGFSKGIYYDNYGASAQSIVYESCMIYDIQGSGGDSFDIRKTSSIGSVSFSDCTFYDGFRTMFRIDANASLTSFLFDHNTVSNVVNIDDGNNNGIFHIRAAVSDFTVTNNIFLNVFGRTDKSAIVSANSASVAPTTVASNFYYNVGEFFWNADKFTEAQGIAGGGAVLASEPCVDSYGGKFYVTDAIVAAAGAGDPRWLTEYVEVPEDLTQTAVQPVYTWDFTDAKNFRGSADVDMVRDNIRFYVKTKPIEFTGNGIAFGSAAETDAAGVPVDGGIGFIVDKPGSVILSVAQAESGSVNDHLSISLDGTVMGAAYVGAENMKVVFPDVEGQHAVYLYPCGPIVLTALQWSDDIESGAETILETPVPVIDTPSVNEGESKTVTVTWPAVNKAASYDVTLDGTVNNVTEPSFSFEASSLEAGRYIITIVAKPADTDPIRQPSEPASVDFTVNEALAPTYVEKTWGADYFKALQDTYGTENLTADFVSDGLGFVVGSGTIKFGNTNDIARVQSGSGAPGTKACYQIMIGGNGTLTVNALSSGDPGREVVVALNDTEIGRKQVVGKDETPTDLVYEITGAKSGDIINIYSGGSSINFMSFKWTPAPTGGIPSDPDAIETATDIIAGFTPDVSQTLAAAGQSATIGKVTYTAKSDKDIVWDGERIKLQGASTVDEGTGLPDGNVVSFKVTKPGTIKHYIRSGSSSDEERTVKIDLVMNDGADIVNIYDAFAPTPGYKEGSETSTAITAEHLAATTSTVTVYIYAPVNSVNIYYLEYIPAE